MEPGPCLTTSLPVAPARATLAEAHHLGDLTGVVTVVVQAPVMNDAPGARAPAQAEAAVGVGRGVMTGDLPARARAAMTEAVSESQTPARIVGQSPDLEAGQIGRASGVARC
jgi:hypothetical protein